LVVRFASNNQGSPSQNSDDARASLCAMALDPSFSQQVLMFRCIRPVSLAFVYFAPTSPGEEIQLVPTDPERRFELLLRCYGPKKVF